MRLRLSPKPARRAGVATAAAALVAVALSPLSPSSAVSAADPITPAAGAGGHPTTAFTTVGGAKHVNTLTGTKASSSIAQTPADLKGITSAAAIPVVIKYDYDALASYRGALQGFAATSPSATGAKGLDVRSSASKAYLGKIAELEGKTSSAIKAAVPGAEIGASLRVVYGGVVASVPGNAISKILAVPGVVAVQRDSLNQLTDDASSTFIGSGDAYTALGGQATAGEGLLLGNLDSGVWPEHPALAARADLPPYSGPTVPCDFGDNPLTEANDPFVCNNKLVSGQAFLGTYIDNQGSGGLLYTTARDSEGHGSHTATTSAGNVVKKAETLGPVVKNVGGIAPGAQVAEYRVCGPAGCYSSDSADAVDQAVADGVDVINFSISGGNNPATDPVEQAFLDAYNAGVFVATSAGNDGPGAGTANHASPWITTVAASTQARAFVSHLTITADGDTYEVDGASITAGAEDLPVVRASAAPYSNNLCATPATPGTFSAMIVVCERGGGIGRIQKGYNVLQGGAAAMILYNPTQADIETDNHFLPTVHVADGTDLVAFLDAHPAGVSGSFTAGTKGTDQGDVMAAFSSRGPLGNFLKPDITAPGVQILAATTPTPDSVDGGPEGEYWQAIAGTSMSSPHIAGAALLVKAVHPDWTPGQIKSALMTQAKKRVVKEDLVTKADPFDMGAGRVRVGHSLDAPLTISASGADMETYYNDPDNAIDLNIPSINAPALPGRVTTTRTLENVSDTAQTVTPSANRVPAGTTITFDPASATVDPGDEVDFDITISTTAPLGAQRFANVVFSTADTKLQLPVAFKRAQPHVSLDQECDDASIAKGSTTTCTVTATNESDVEQDVSLTTTGDTKVSPVGGPVTESATLAPTTLGVPELLEYTESLYEELDGKPGNLVVPIGDEAISNIDVPAYIYNGQTYTRIGVDSNGYLKVGGITAADHECCELPTGADPAAPNDIVAPFWTDLDGTGKTGLTVNVLSYSGGAIRYLVVQWTVNVYGTDDERRLQAWFGLNGEQDVSVSYSEAQADPNGQLYLVGAENAAGEGEMVEYLPENDIFVVSSDPEPGGSYSYDVEVEGTKIGVGNLHTEMEATGVNGVTTVDTPITVTSRRPPQP